MNHPKVFRIIQVLSVFGIILSIYLLWEQFFHPAFQPCTINSVVNCDAIISGTVSKTFGISTPIYGLVGYIVIFFAAMFQKKMLLVFMAAFGLLFCLWIAYKELFQLHVICPVCILCQLTMITIFTLAIIVYAKRKS